MIGHWHQQRLCLEPRIEVIHYPDDVIGGEPIFAPRNGTGEEDLVFCVFSDRRGVARCAVSCAVQRGCTAGFVSTCALQDDGYMVALLFNEKTQESTFTVYDAACLGTAPGTLR